MVVVAAASSWASEKCPFRSALCSGVTPFLAAAETSAPRSTN